LGKPTQGGIDLKDTAVNTFVRKEGNGVEMAIEAVMIDRIKRQGINGLTPVIYRMVPLASIWPLVGLEPSLI
jgi:hypothetical protein